MRCSYSEKAQETTLETGPDQRQRQIIRGLRDCAGLRLEGATARRPDSVPITGAPESGFLGREAKAT